MFQINVWDYLENSREKYGGKTALVDSEKSLTFDELYEKSVSVGRYINARFRGAVNRPIAVYLPKGVDCICCFLGIVYSGNYYVPLDYNSPRSRIDVILKTLDPMMIIAGDEREFFEGYECALYGDCAGCDAEDDYRGMDRVLDVDPLYVLFTSGSTGTPKGVIISHRSVIDYTEWLADTFAFDDNTVFGNLSPFCFDNTVLEIYSTLKNGGRLVILPENSFVFPTKALGSLNENGVNTLFWVPSALVSLANSGKLSQIKLRQLKAVLFCGEVMPNKQLNIWRREYPDVLYANLYGPTEITDVCTYYIVDREFDDDDPLPIGKACRNTEIIVLNDSDEEVKGSETGELCVRGICLSHGYLNNFDKTGKAFVQNPLNKRYYEKIYRTGDLVRYNELGELIYICRKDYQIKHQGYRIELGEIESTVSAFDGVKQCCAVYNEERKRIVLFCACRRELNEKELYKQAKNKLPKYMLPSKIRIIDEMPYNINGKIDRNKLKDAEMSENE